MVHSKISSPTKYYLLAIGFASFVANADISEADAQLLQDEKDYLLSASSVIKIDFEGIVDGKNGTDQKTHHIISGVKFSPELSAAPDLARDSFVCGSAACSGSPFGSSVYMVATSSKYLDITMVPDTVAFGASFGDARGNPGIVDAKFEVFGDGGNALFFETFNIPGFDRYGTFLGFRAINGETIERARISWSAADILVVDNVLLATNSVRQSNESLVRNRADNAVSLRQGIGDNAIVKTFSVWIGSEERNLANLNSILKDGGKVLRVNSMTSRVRTAQSIQDSIAFVELGTCDQNNAFRSVHGAEIAVTGEESHQVKYEPGLVVSLDQDRDICLRSSSSNVGAVIGIHGYLQDQE